MTRELIDRLCCPKSGESLELLNGEFEEGQIRSGMLASKHGERYPVRDFIPRFVPEHNYASSFGMQWNRFARTQLDSASGHPISANRFWHATGWRSDQLAGKWVLDVGCGSGRFAEIALRAGAHVVAVDYSTAVDACYQNLRAHFNFHIVQADIYALPLAPERFDFVYALGVLQHTPDVERAFRALPPMLAAGGRLCVDFYERSWKSRLLPKYWLRPLTTKLPAARLFSGLRYVIPVLLPVSRAAAAVPGAGSVLKRAIPVANYYGELPLDDRQQREWALLDTFDWLAPRFDNPQTPGTVARWLQQSGLQETAVLKAGHLVGRGVKPSGSRA